MAELRPGPYRGQCCNFTVATVEFSQLLKVYIGNAIAVGYHEILIIFHIGDACV